MWPPAARFGLASAAATTVSPVTAVLLATDADWIFDEVEAALGGDGLTVYRVHAGVDVLPAIREVEPDLVILDLQIGNMGGMATCMSIRHEEGMGRIPITAVMMLLDRAADIFLAHRADADGWVIKPLDAFRLRRATHDPARRRLVLRGRRPRHRPGRRRGHRGVIVRVSGRRLPPTGSAHLAAFRWCCFAPLRTPSSVAGSLRVPLWEHRGRSGTLSALTGCSAAW